MDELWIKLRLKLHFFFQIVSKPQYFETSKIIIIISHTRTISMLQNANKFSLFWTVLVWSTPKTVQDDIHYMYEIHVNIRQKKPLKTRPIYGKRNSLDLLFFFLRMKKKTPTCIKYIHHLLSFGQKCILKLFLVFVNMYGLCVSIFNKKIMS
jgi:hypothetical protein